MKNLHNYFRFHQILFFIFLGLFTFLTSLVFFWIGDSSWGFFGLLATFFFVWLGGFLNKWHDHHAKGRKLFLQGKYAEALEELNKSWKLAKRFGDQDPRPAAVLWGQAEAYRYLGDFWEAEDCAQEAYELFQKIWGPDHFYTACVANEFALVNLELAKFDLAEKLFLQVLFLIEKKKIKSPLLQGTILNNLGKMYSDLRKFAESEKYFRQALDFFEKSKNKKLIPFGMMNVGFALAKQGQLKEAEDLCQKSLEKFESLLGKNHFYCSYPLKTLGHIRLKEKKFQQAEKFLLESLELSEENLGIENPFHSSILHDLVKVCAGQGRWKEAEEFARRELYLRQEYYVPNHPALQESIDNFSDLLQQMGKSTEAMEFKFRAQEMIRDFRPETSKRVPLLNVTDAIKRKKDSGGGPTL